MIARGWHTLTAALVLAGLVIQCVIAVRVAGSPPAHAVGTLAGAALPVRILRVFSFFTIQSNVLVGVTTAQLAVRPDRDGRAWRVLRLNGLVGIAVTGIVYSTVLARIHEPKGWDQVSTNFVFHYAVPVLAVLGWLIFGPRPRIDARVIALSLVWPLAWFAYTLLHGRVSKWYPYPFVDAATHGYVRVLVNALLVTLVLAAVSAVYALGDRRLRREP